MDLIAESLAGSAPWQAQSALFVLLVLGAAGGFAVGRWLGAERVRQAEWRLRRAESMCNSLRKLSDDYRKRLHGRSPQQAEKKLKEQERKLSVLRFQVASLTGELDAMRPPPRGGKAETIDLTRTCSRGESRR